ncbi:hypothetical protein CFIMG_002665RAa [Ceratocystis fimbriata CBS 114723]|uniref:Uncharacterized protein n=1 Tax=Ceratocystis fimbriata CBS 114723 TaxID=1035309 RepID=A0A2C5X5G0_9PEZI|nr:hypothetical protein CFIMG_002665RAa [Ceratocystis fimbriata CBS 114723]
MISMATAEMQPKISHVSSFFEKRLHVCMVSKFPPPMALVVRMAPTMINMFLRS